MFYDNGIIVADWQRGIGKEGDWGERLNSELIHKLSGLPVAHIKDVTGWQNRPVFRVIGGNLKSLSDNDIIWGMGLSGPAYEAEKIPSQICAVRGPLTRERLMDVGIACPEIYGDPAVLYPLIFRPEVQPQHDFGIILDGGEASGIGSIELPASGSVLHIDICGGLQEVVRSILSCKIIVSASLHGIICAHAYGLPAYWMTADDPPHGNFEFLDYFRSIGWDEVEPTRLSAEWRMQFGSLVEPDRPMVNGLMLIDSCPFLSSTRKQHWKGKLVRGKAGRLRGTIFH